MEKKEIDKIIELNRKIEVIKKRLKNLKKMKKLKLAGKGDIFIAGLLSNETLTECITIDCFIMGIIEVTYKQCIKEAENQLKAI